MPVATSDRDGVAARCEAVATPHPPDRDRRRRRRARRRHARLGQRPHPARTRAIGDECIVGEKTYIAYDVRIGDRVKINAFVYICTAVTIEDGVMISAGTVFTNDRFPRATTPDLGQLRPSDPDEHTLPTLVRAGATIGAGLHDRQRPRDRPLRDGRHGLRRDQDGAATSTWSLGHPARPVGGVCRCGAAVAALRGHDAAGASIRRPLRPARRCSRALSKC